MAKEKKKAGCGSQILALFVLVGGCGYLLTTIDVDSGSSADSSSTNSEPASKQQTDQKPKPDGGGARYAGREFARKLLKNVLTAPTTAEYPWGEVQSAKTKTIEGVQTWVVRGVVDAQNAFGAKVRNRWEVLVGLDEGEYFPVYVGLGGETVHGSRAYRDQALQ